MLADHNKKNKKGKEYKAGNEYNLSEMKQYCESSDKKADGWLDWRMYAKLPKSSDSKFHTVSFLANADNVSECAKLFKHGVRETKRGIHFTYDAVKMYNILKDFQNGYQAMNILGVPNLGN